MCFDSTSLNINIEEDSGERESKMSIRTETIITPVMLCCDEFGELGSIRVVCAKVEVDADRMQYQPWYSKGERVHLLSDYSELHIQRLVHTAIHNVSMHDVSCDKLIRMRIWTPCKPDAALQKPYICGVNAIPVKLGNGVILNKGIVMLLADVIAPDDINGHRQTMYFIDYNGKVYTEEEFCNKYAWAGAYVVKVAVLRHTDDLVQSNDAFEADANKGIGIGNVALSIEDSGRFLFDKQKYNLHKEAQQQELASTSLMQSHVEIRVDSTGSRPIALVGKVTSAISIPSCCVKAYVSLQDTDASKPAAIWTCKTTAPLDCLEIYCCDYPRFLLKSSLNVFSARCVQSRELFKLPTVIAAKMDSQQGASLRVQINKPMPELSVDYTKGVYDCNLCHVLLGTQQSDRVLLPGARELKYAVTLNRRNFVAQIKPDRCKCLMTKTEPQYACFLLGAISRSSETERVVIDTSAVHYTAVELFMTLYKSIGMLNSERTIKAALNLADHTSFVTVGQKGAVDLTVTGKVIDTLLYIPSMPRNFGAGVAHINARVKTLCFCMGDFAEPLDPIYLYEGVENVVLLISTSEYPVRNLDKFKQYLSSVKIHVPRNKAMPQLTDKVIEGEQNGLFLPITTHMDAVYHCMPFGVRQQQGAFSVTNIEREGIDRRKPLALEHMPQPIKDIIRQEIFVQDL